LRANVEADAPGLVHLDFTGEPGWRVALEASDDLRTWATIQPAHTLGPDGRWSVTVENTGAQRFFRVRPVE
jgi:hypothetical protein